MPLMGTFNYLVALSSLAPNGVDRCTTPWLLHLDMIMVQQVCNGTELQKSHMI